MHELTESQLKLVQSKVDKLQLKARKLHSSPITLDVVGKRYHEYEDGSAVLLYQVVLSGDEPVISGWRFLGSIEHNEAGNIIRLSPEAQQRDDLDLTAWRTGPQRCDHCEKVRVRKDTFILEEIPTREDGWFVRGDGKVINVVDPDEEWSADIMQVGRQCLKDFLGHGDPQGILAYLSDISTIVSDMDEDERSWHGGAGEYNDRCIRLDTYLSHVAAIIDDSGWMSVSKAQDMYRTATRDLALDNMDKLARNRSGWGRERPPIQPTATHVDLATATIAWVRDYIGTKSVVDRDDYEHTMFVAMSEDYITRRHCGVAASSITAYQRHLGRQAERASMGVSIHVGDVGDALSIKDVVATHVFKNTNAWGVSYLNIMRDPNGNVFVWSTSALALSVGNHYRVYGKVKEHTEFRGIKQTMLTRCKVVFLGPPEPRQTDAVPPVITIDMRS